MYIHPIYWGQRWLGADITKHLLLWQFSMRQKAEAAPKLHFRIIFGTLPSAKCVSSISLRLRVISSSGLSANQGSIVDLQGLAMSWSLLEKKHFFCVIEMVQVSWINYFHAGDSAPFTMWLISSAIRVELLVFYNFIYKGRQQPQLLVELSKND